MFFKYFMKIEIKKLFITFNKQVKNKNKRGGKKVKYLKMMLIF